MLGGDGPLRPSARDAPFPRPGPPSREPAAAMSGRFLQAGPRDARVRCLLAHGAGAGMDTPFMNVTAALLAERDIATLRFEFAYMAGRRSGGPRKPPPKAERLVEE